MARVWTRLADEQDALLRESARSTEPVALQQQQVPPKKKN
jgi:hypothetical protein